jgi:hypothetical protein
VVALKEPHAPGLLQVTDHVRTSLVVEVPFAMPAEKVAEALMAREDGGAPRKRTEMGLTGGGTMAGFPVVHPARLARRRTVTRRGSALRMVMVLTL